jgi:hypothetical protein
VVSSAPQKERKMQRRFIKFGKRVVKKKKPSREPFNNWTIVTGDHVYILDGKDRGKDGVVTKVRAARTDAPTLTGLP